MRFRNFSGGIFQRLQAVVLLLSAGMLAVPIPERANAQDLTGAIRDSWTGVARDPQRFHSRPGFIVDPLRQLASLAERFPNGVALRLEQRFSLAANSVVSIFVRSDRDGLIAVLDIDAAGQLVQIFPNERSLRVGVPRRVSAGQEVRLPGVKGGYHFGALPSSGRGTFVAVVVPGESARLQDLVSRHEDLSAVDRPNAYLAEFVEALGIGSGAVAGILAYEWISQKE